MSYLARKSPEAKIHKNLSETDSKNFEPESQCSSVLKLLMRKIVSNSDSVSKNFNCYAKRTAFVARYQLLRSRLSFLVTPLSLSFSCIITVTSVKHPQIFGSFIYTHKGGKRWASVPTFLLLMSSRLIIANEPKSLNFAIFR